MQLSNNKTGWIIIPSKTQDMKNFKENVGKLKALSDKTWCTKTYKADTYLAQGEFHIYYEAGRPKLGLAFDSDRICEMRDEKNHREIPHKYYETLKNHINKESLKMSIYEKPQYIKAGQVAKVYRDIGEAIKNNDTYTIFNYFGFHPTKTEKGKLILKEYKQTYPLTFRDCDIDEEKIFADVVKIEGNADFRSSQLKTLANLEYVGGDITRLDFSKIESLGALKEVGGNIDFSGSTMLSLGNLEKIGGNASFYRCLLNDFGALKSIKGNLYINLSVKSLQNLEYIGGNAIIDSEILNDLGRLKSVEGNLYIESPQLQDLGLLEKVEGKANFSYVKGLRNTGNLISVGGDAYFNDTNVKEFANLRQVNGNLYVNNTDIENLDILENVNGKIYLNDNTFQDLDSAKAFLKSKKQVSIDKKRSFWEILCSSIWKA